MRQAKIVIDPSSRMLYSSFYIYGLYELYGKKNVSFSSKWFADLKRKTESHSFDHYMAFVVITRDNQITKVIIDFRDKPSVKESAYDWCDKYAKINFNKELTPRKFQAKIISIPPGFGIKIWGLSETLLHCFSNYIKCRLSPLVSIRNHLADYYAQYRRPLLERYISTNGSDYSRPYVFMIATLWTNKGASTGVNLLRRKFVELVKKANTEFEGGFFALPDHPQYEEYKNVIFRRQYSVHEYLMKTRESVFVFNTPAVHNCHGWKLGEYLAMGKAIISTPLVNELPELLEHGENIHFVDNIDEMEDAVNLVLSDSVYRRRLKIGARKYFLQFASPSAVLKDVISY